ncbi:MAG: hypothetical protein ACLTZT_08005 [Butyricimonas faecalis]
MFSLSGKTKTLPFSKADTLLNVILEEEVSELDEVQVIAYGNNHAVIESVPCRSKADEIKDLLPSINNLYKAGLPEWMSRT